MEKIPPGNPFNKILETGNSEREFLFKVCLLGKTSLRETHQKLGSARPVGWAGFSIPVVLHLQILFVPQQLCEQEELVRGGNPLDALRSGQS